MGKIPEDDFESRKIQVQRDIEILRRNLIANDEPLLEHLSADFEKRTEQFNFGEKRQAAREAIFKHQLNACRALLGFYGFLEKTRDAYAEFDEIKSQQTALAGFYQNGTIMGKANPDERLLFPGRFIKWRRSVTGDVKENALNLLKQFTQRVESGAPPASGVSDKELINWLKFEYLALIRIREAAEEKKNRNVVTSHVARG